MVLWRAIPQPVCSCKVLYLACDIEEVPLISPDFWRGWPSLCSPRPACISACRACFSICSPGEGAWEIPSLGETRGPEFRTTLAFPGLLGALDPAYFVIVSSLLGVQDSLSHSRACWPKERIWKWGWVYCQLSKISICFKFELGWNHSLEYSWPLDNVSLNCMSHWYVDFFH